MIQRLAIAALLLALAAPAVAQPGPEQALKDAKALIQAGKPDAGLAAVKTLAEQGYPPAQNAFGFALQHGNGLPRDPAAALVWFRRAADQGFADAQFNLGFMLQDRKSVV